MKEQVLCVIPEGMSLNGEINCLELVKALYSLKQALRVWKETFDESVCSMGFQLSVLDPDDHCVLVLVYVDDVLVTENSPKLIARTKVISRHAFKLLKAASVLLFLESNFWTVQMKA
ncbi:hypothetical protein DD238_006977 [Peronospora effusa]|uniref:Reverse transcriptase Ty1/copia-type domain-containing protein n=1 Tax=Peronospora effusa TaxID=542832 RepID=A0A3M6VHP3_9STRA|nr:hypothetical protein DD238_006977 [Peronospora effusa]RQM13113.1 hypothetical protein DD237_007243 [Peronospora effusa]